MKKAVAFGFALFVFSCCVFAQGGRPTARKLKSPGQHQGVDTIVFPLKANDKPAATARTRQPNQTKLDDLKNPFDTSKKVQAKESNFSRGNSNPTHQNTNRQANTPVKRHINKEPVKKRDDSVYFKGRNATVPSGG